MITPTIFPEPKAVCHCGARLTFLPHTGWFCEECEKRDKEIARCADCGEEGELTGHQSCQYPQNH